MKKFVSGLCPVIVLLLCMQGLTACSDSEPVNWYPEPEGKVFTELNGLVLTLNGTPVIGKTAEVVAGSDSRHVQIILYSKFDTALIPGLSSAGDMIVDASGVLPGTPRLEIPVELISSGENESAFSGKGSTDYVNYSYQGTVGKNGLKLAFTDVSLINQQLAGASFKLQKFDPGNNISPIYAVWEPAASTLIDIDGTKVPASVAIKKVLEELPLVKAGEQMISVAQMLGLGNVKIDFGADGSVDIAGLPAGSLQYIVDGTGSLRLYINPQNLILGSRAAGNVDNSLVEILATISSSVVPMLQNGIPLNFTPSSDGVNVYMPTTALLPIVKGTILPIATNDALSGYILGLVEGLPDGATLAPLARGIMAGLPAAINNTTKLELGLSLVRAD